MSDIARRRGFACVALLLAALQGLTSLCCARVAAANTSEHGAAPQLNSTSQWALSSFASAASDLPVRTATRAVHPGPLQLNVSSAGYAHCPTASLLRQNQALIGSSALSLAIYDVPNAFLHSFRLPCPSLSHLHLT